MKTLLMIYTYKYPYSPPVEQFLNMEIPYLDDDDTDIVLIPNARDIDKNVAYFNVDERENISVKPIKRCYVLKETFIGAVGVFRCFPSFIKDCIKALKNVKSSKKDRALKLTVFQYLQAMYFLREMKSMFCQKEFESYDKIALYSYWLNSTSAAVALYKSYLEKQGIKNVSAVSRAHGQGDLYIEDGFDYYRPLSDVLANGLDVIYSISADGKQHLSKQNINNVSVSRLGVSDPVITRSSKDEIPLIVSCSVINENKRVSDIAKVISKIEMPINWVHFGDGDGFDELFDWCTFNMPKNVSWKLKGRTNHEEIMQFYAGNSPDLFINLSMVEGIPVSIMEAFSYSIPAVATNVGATAEIVEDSKTGYLVEKDYDLSDIVALINKCISKPEDMHQMGVNAYDMFKSNYSSSNNFSDFSKCIKNN